MKIKELEKMLAGLPDDVKNSDFYVALVPSPYDNRRAEEIEVNVDSVSEYHDILEVVVDCEDDTVLFRGKL